MYRQLIANKPELEELLWKVQDGWESCEAASGGQSISPVNKYIHQVNEQAQAEQFEARKQVLCKDKHKCF